MLARLKRNWRAFRRYPPGKRFRAMHRRQRNVRTPVRILLVAGAVLAFAAGVVLSILPGPAFVFFGVAGAIAAMQSTWVARTLDRGEVAARRLIARVRAWRRRHGQRYRPVR